MVPPTTQSGIETSILGNGEKLKMSTGDRRGRGRGWIQNDKVTKPQRPFCPEDVNHEAIIKLIDTVNDENSVERASEIVKLVTHKTNEHNLENVHKRLYDHALNDKEFGVKLLTVYHCSVFRTVPKCENTSLYANLIRCFQIGYERRRELRDENVIQFYNAISLFSELLPYMIKSEDKDFVCKLLLALLDYMEMLIETSSAEDIRIFAEQVITHGKHIYRFCKAETDNLMIAVRQKLINDNMSVTSRRILLYVIDLYNRNFDLLPHSLQKFYKSELENDFKEEDKNIIIESLRKTKDNNRE